MLRPALPGLADEMIVAISAEVPDYARAMEGTFGQLVRMGVEVALNRFMDLVAEPRADATPARDTYVNLGRGEFHAGRSLDALLAAYRVGARLAWRRFVEAGTAAAPAARRPVLARRGDLRLHRRDLRRVGRRLRRGAVRRRGREPAPAPAPRAAAGAAPARLAGGGAHGGAGRRLAAAAPRRRARVRRGRDCGGSRRRRRAARRRARRGGAGRGDRRGRRHPARPPARRRGDRRSRGRPRLRLAPRPRRPRPSPPARRADRR